MKRLSFTILALILSCFVTSSVAGTLDSDLENRLNSISDDHSVSVLVYLSEQVDLNGISRQMDNRKATLRERHEVVVTSLQDIANQSQGDLINYLQEQSEAGNVTDFRAFWVTNCIYVEASKTLVERIAERSDVAKVYFNYEIELVAPVEMKTDTRDDILTPEPGVDAVRAPEVWDMGFTGSGVLVANMDTGVDGDHPALASRWAGVADPRYDGHPEWAWYDPYNNQNDFPYDNHGHGTHTMGSVCGGAPGDQVGVAPGAYWIAAAPIDRGGGIPRTVADAILSFEWFVDPDGNPGTNWDVPAVMSNSWGLTTGHGYPPCDELFWSYLDACEAAGTVILFSAGNEGYSGLRRPADRATDEYRTCAVAAVDANQSGWPIASFSSRGPTYCTPDGSAAIKPDIAAPGVDVRSSYPGGGYTQMSGTSMASPHVNGVVALIRQANPNLPVDMVKQIIYDTAYDLGDPGEDNSYGWGMIDAYEAVQLALSYLEGYGVVRGQVTDAFTGDGLPGMITVTNHDPEIVAHCNNEGFYSLYVPADSAWDLRAEYTDDYQPAYATVTVPEDDTVYQDFALLPPDFEITMTPDDPPIYVHPGEYFTYTGTLTNQTEDDLTTDVWIMLEAPEYGTVGPLKRYNNVPIGAGETISVSNIRQNVPNIAPIGLYEYIAYCGDYPDVIEDQYSFTFVVWPEGGALAEVVILCADYTNDWYEARDMLLEDPNVLGVDFIDVRESTPELTDLMPYNVALVWSNYTFANTNALGDVLADFADLGGGVVTCEFAHYGGWALGGRYMTDYSPLGVGSSGYSNTDLIVDDPNHPIMLGVTSGSEYYNYDPPFTAENYTMVCHWDNGHNGTTVNADHPRCVAINNYFGQSYAQWTGDVGQMMVNSVVWSANNSFSIASFEGPEGFLDEYAVEEKREVSTVARINNNSEPATKALGFQERGGTEGIPTSYSLSDAYPNPFNAAVKLNFALPEQTEVRLDIYNMMGQKVSTLVDGQMEPGVHSVTWNAADNASGIYFYKLTTGGFTSTKRMALVK